VDRLELVGWVDAQLLGEPRAQPLVGGEGVGLPPRPGERAHQLAVEPLLARVFGDELVQLGDQVVAGAHGEVGLDAVLDGAQAQRLEPDGGRLGEARSGRVGQRRPAPQRERLPQRRRRLPGVHAQLLPARPGERLEADRVDRLRIE
jgi:hypothetical protein